MPAAVTRSWYSSPLDKYLPYVIYLHLQFETIVATWKKQIIVIKNHIQAF